MKKTIALLLCAAMIFSFCACGDGGKTPDKPKEPVLPGAGPDITTGTVDLEYFGMRYDFTTYLGTTEYVYVISPGYEGLQNAFEEYNSAERAALWDNRETAKEYIEDETFVLPEERFPLYCNTSVSFARIDSFMTSFFSFEEGDFAGAHGWYCADGFNYDTQTGAKLTLRDVVTDYDAFMNNFLPELSKANAESYDNGFDEHWEDTVKELLADDYTDWVGTPDGITIWFDPYVLGSYALGLVECEFKYEGNEALFAEKYIPAGEKTPPATKESADGLGTYLYRNIVLPVEESFGTLSYEDACKLIENDANLKDYTIEYTEPWSTESSGDIMIRDKENGCQLYIFFAPETDENGAFSHYGGPVQAREIWYRSQTFCASFDGGYGAPSAEHGYYFIDYTNYESFPVASRDELTKLMFMYTAYKE